MLKVMIVDDEYLIRQYIRNCIDWEQAGYHIVGEIGTAQAALRMVEETQPDLVLTDICMPGIDGLSFARMIKSSCPSVRIVVVTGYDNFEYARRGIHIGIDDYLLKPIDSEELFRTVTQLKEQIMEQRQQNLLFQELVDYHNRNMKIVREYYLQSLLEGNTENILDASVLDSLTLPQEGVFQVVTLDLHDFSGAMLKGKLREGNRGWLEDYLEPYQQQNQWIWVTDRFGHIVLIIKGEQKQLCRQLAELSRAWEQEFHFSLWYGIGSVQYRLASVRDSYLQANSNLNNAIAVGDSELFAQKGNLLTEQEQNVITPEEVKKLYQYISIDSRQQMVEQIDRWFELFKQSKRIDLSYFKINVLNTIFYLYLMDHDKNSGEDFQREYAQHYQHVFQIPALMMLKQYLTKFCESLSEKHKNSNSVRPSKLIFEIRQYMIEHMGDVELSLSSTAKAFYLNSSYLSRIFKQEMKVSFVEYLSSLRIEKAKTLLRDSDLKIYEISHQVGIDNPNYLGILFKKLVGCSPLEYRSSHQNG